MAQIVLPHNEEAERCVLCAMLMDENAAATGLARLQERSFSGVDPRNPLIFRAMVNCANAKSAIDATTVIASLQNLHLYDQAGGAEYIFEILNAQITPGNADHYITIVKDTAALRDFLQKLSEIQEDYTRGGAPSPGDFMEKATSDLRAISEERSVGDFESAAEVAKQVQRRIDYISARSNDKHLTGVDTGYIALNRITHGWQRGDLIILAARTSVGKTAFAVNLAYNGAALTGHPVALFSLEMSNEQVLTRLLSSVSLVSGDKIATGDLRKEDKIKIRDGLKQLSDCPLYFDDSPSAKLGDIISKTRKLQSEHPDLALVVIDYLTLINLETKGNSTAEDIGEITMALKSLARNLKIPVLCLAQLNRDVEGNDDNRPKLSNLKGSGNIEQDADMVLLMYRSDYYAETGHKKDADKGMAKEGTSTRMLQEQVKAEKVKDTRNSISVVEISVAKNRNGAIGNFALMFDKDHSRFDNPSVNFQENIEKVKQGHSADSLSID